MPPGHRQAKDRARSPVSHDRSGGSLACAKAVGACSASHANVHRDQWHSRIPPRGADVRRPAGRISVLVGEHGRSLLLRRVVLLLHLGASAVRGGVESRDADLVILAIELDIAALLNLTHRLGISLLNHGVTVLPGFAGYVVELGISCVTTSWSGQLMISLDIILTSRRNKGGEVGWRE